MSIDELSAKYAEPVSTAVNLPSIRDLVNTQRAAERARLEDPMALWGGEEAPQGPAPKAILPRITTEGVQAPRIWEELVRAYTAPRRAYEEGFTPEQAAEEAANMALNVEMGGGLGSHVGGPTDAVLGMAVKQRGGNWLEKTLESGGEYTLTPEELVDQVKRASETFDFERLSPEVVAKYEQELLDPTIPQPRRIHLGVLLRENRDQNAMGQWLEQKLGKYIRNEMGTPDDPLVKLADEEGISLLGEGQLGAIEEMRLQTRAELNRNRSEHGVATAKTTAGENWEGTVDSIIRHIKAKDWKAQASAFDIEQNPWAANSASPEDYVNYLRTNSTVPLAREMNFDHLADNLRTALGGSTDEGNLPEALRLTPEQLKKVSLTDAVRRSKAIDDWRSAEALKMERMELMDVKKSSSRFDAPTFHPGFVEEKGGKWIDIPDTSDEKARGLCTKIGKAGGWCTMDASTSADYGSKQGRLVALVDAEGRPHVQIQTSIEPDPSHPSQILQIQPVGNTFGSKQAQEYIRRDPDYKAKVSQQVLDFLNGGEWLGVDEVDLQKFGIIDTEGLDDFIEEIEVMNVLSDAAKEAWREGDYPKVMDEIDDLTHKFMKDAPRFMTRDQLRERLKPGEGHAEGGPVKGYAEGGPVEAPNAADYVVEGIREFPERTVEGAVNVGKAIFDQMNPEQQRALTRAYNAGGDLFGRLVEHVAQSPTGQSIRATLTGVDIATRPAQEAYAAAQAKQEGVQAPSPMDNPLFDWMDVGPAGKAMDAALAFHGSPHKMSKWGKSAEHVGTGEGQSAYGKGLYLAESEGIGKNYAKNTPRAALINKIEYELPDDADIEDVMGLLGTGTFTKEQEAVIKALNDDDWLGFDRPLEAIANAYHKLDNFDPSPELVEAIKNNSHFYTVDVPDEWVNSRMLDWDAPFSEQSPYIREKLGDFVAERAAEVNQLRKTMLDKYRDGRLLMRPSKKDLETWRTPVDPQNYTGKNIYSSLQQKFGAIRPGDYPQEAADFLKELGIPGHKYFDRTSRGAQEGTRNFVIYPGNEDAVKILKRNDVPFDSPEFKKGGPVDFNELTDKYKING